MLHAMRSYSGWSNEPASKKKQLKTATSVRVSSDTLLRRMSPRSRFRLNGRGPSIPESWISNSSCEASGDERRRASPINLKADTINSSFDDSDKLDPLMLALKANNFQAAQVIIDQDHSPSQVIQVSDHYVICAESVPDAVFLLILLRQFDQCSDEMASNPVCASQPVNTHSEFSPHRIVVLLLAEVPSAKDLAKCIDTMDHTGLSFHRVYFVAGSSSRCKDLNKVAVDQALRVLILPSQGSNSSNQTAECGDCDEIYDASESNEDQTADEENIADFSAIRSLLAIETNHQQQNFLQTGNELIRSYRRSMVLGSTNTRQPESTFASLYQRDVEHGLPLESARLRVLQRFPDLNPGIFREQEDANEVALNDLSFQQSIDPSSTSCDKAIAVLHYARSARFCRPTDPTVCHEDYPLLAPAFACGHIMISSVLDRVLCQAFYNPYITDVIRALACGSFLPQNHSASFKNVPSHDTRDRFSQLRRVPLDAVHIGLPFMNVFLDLLAKRMVVIALWRATSSSLENLQPFVYTCPTPDTILHTNDELFVLG